MTANASVGSIRKMSRKASDTFGTRATPTSLQVQQEATGVHIIRVKNF
jgi:hypothetical protein